MVHTHTNRATFQALLHKFRTAKAWHEVSWSGKHVNDYKILQDTTSIRIDVAWYGVVRGPWWSSRTAKAKLFSSPAEKASLKRRLKPRHRQAGLPCRPNAQTTWLNKKHQKTSLRIMIKASAPADFLDDPPNDSPGSFFKSLIFRVALHLEYSRIIMHQLALSCLSHYISICETMHNYAKASTRSCWFLSVSVGFCLLSRRGW